MYICHICFIAVSTVEAGSARLQLEIPGLNVQVGPCAATTVGNYYRRPSLIFREECRCDKYTLTNFFGRPTGSYFALNLRACRPVTGPTTTAAPPQPTTVAPVEGTTNAAPVEGTTNAAPVEGTTNAAPVEGTTDAAPVEGTTDAAPVEGTTDAAPVEGTTDAAPVEGTTNAAPVEGTTESAAPVEGSTVLPVE